MKVIAGIITFEPDINQLLLNIQAVERQVEELVIIDNCSSNIEEIKNSLITQKGIKVIENKENLGIAKALNQIFEVAMQKNYEWVLTLDQDSVIPNNMLEEYREILNLVDDAEIICPRIHDRVSGKTWPSVLNRMELVERCITSGSLNCARAWLEVNGFDEYLFIDEVDHDYCHRVVEHDGKIYVARDVVLEHQIGDTKIRKVFGKTIYVRNHSAFRKYYITRNILYISRKYNGHVLFKDIIHVFAFIVKTIIYEEQKGKKLRACLKGMKDGWKSNEI